METILISVPYVYPLCPLNFNHAKMFVIADVFARYACLIAQKEDVRLIFPIASHYSGNTAQTTSSILGDYFNGIKQEESIKILDLYKSFYKVPVNIIRKFKDSNYLMSYFNEEILWELKSLAVSCDFNDAYTTNDSYFDDFVRSIFCQYSKYNLLVKNKKEEFAINYDDAIWRKETVELINNTSFNHIRQKISILSALNNLSSGWECLRSSGFGVKYDDKGLIIDPMFDSELFMVFDLFVYWRNRLKTTISNPAVFFDTLFISLKTKQNDNINGISAEENELIDNIIKCLPCAIFVAEEHLKNWIGKKFFIEQKLLHPDLRTKSYRIIGMAMLDGKRMSASRGHTILARDLIKEYGGVVTRLVLLMSGGNISKICNYERELPKEVKTIMDNFSDYLVFLKSNYYFGSQDFDIEEQSNKINKLIEEGYFRQAIIELLVNIPSSYKNPTVESREKILLLFKKYINIFIPDYAQCYC